MTQGAGAGDVCTACHLPGLVVKRTANSPTTQQTSSALAFATSNQSPTLALNAPDAARQVGNAQGAVVLRLKLAVPLRQAGRRGRREGGHGAGGRAAWRQGAAGRQRCCEQSSGKVPSNVMHLSASSTSRGV